MTPTTEPATLTVRTVRRPAAYRLRRRLAQRDRAALAALAADVYRHARHHLPGPAAAAVTAGTLEELWTMAAWHHDDDLNAWAATVAARRIADRRGHTVTCPTLAEITAIHDRRAYRTLQRLLLTADPSALVLPPPT